MTDQQFTDEDILGISLDEVIRYLENDGWSRIGTYGNNAWIYEYEAGCELIVPKDEDLVDYAFGVRSILRGIARLKEKDPTIEYDDVRFLRHDVFGIRAFDPWNGDGSVSPDDASGLYAGATQLWKSVLSTALGDTAESQRYWQQARYGQIERGNYVVTMISPPVFSDREITLDADAIEQTPTRRVTNALRATTQLARSTVDKMHDGNGLAVERARKNGLDSATCEALLKIVEPFQSISCHISESQLVPKKQTGPSAVEFRSEDAPYLKRLAAGLQERVRLSPQPPTRRNRHSAVAAER